MFNYEYRESKAQKAGRLVFLNTLYPEAHKKFLADWEKESISFEPVHFESFEAQQSFVEDLINTSNVANDEVFDRPILPICRPKPAKLTNSDQNRKKSTKLRQRKRQIEKAVRAEAARDTLFTMKYKSLPQDSTYVSIAYDSYTHYNRIEVEEVKHHFFNDKHLPDFSRLHPSLKLILSQYVLNSQPIETRATSTPFVYRYSLDQRNNTQQQLNKKISKELTAALGRKPLYWLTAEYDSPLPKLLISSQDTTLTHSNGEILLYPEEYQTFIDAMHRVHGKNSDSGTKDRRMMENKIIVTSTPKRASEALKHGNFYSIFNWVSYATKHKDDLYYISSELRKSAAATYTRDIK